MALDVAIKAAVSAAFLAISKLETQVSLVKNSSNPSYNATTGAVTRSSVTHTFNALIIKYERNEIDGVNVLATDGKMIFPQSRLLTTPTTTDTFTISGVSWEIKSVEQDAANATWTIQIRRA